MDPVVANCTSEIDGAIEQTNIDPVGSFGPWLVGLLGYTLMTGVIATQSTRYFSTFGIESRGLFTVIVLCIMLVLAQWIVMVDVSWELFVTRFGDYSVFAAVPWQLSSIPIISRVTVFTAQLFFAHRCYTLYRRNRLIFASLLLGMLASLVLFTVGGVFGAIGPVNSHIRRNLTIPAVGVSLLTDFAIAGLTLWKLGVGGGESYCPNTDDVLRRLRNLTVEAAVPPAMCTMLTMSIYLGTGKKNLGFFTFGIITPILYVFSMLLALNSRRSLRQKLNSPNEGGFFDAGYELSNVLPGSDSKARQTTESRRTTVVFAVTSGPSFAPNASMGIVDERVEGSEGPKPFCCSSIDGDVSFGTPETGHKELQVDLDRWEIPPHSRSVSIRSQRTPEPLPVVTPWEDPSNV